MRFVSLWKGPTLSDSVEDKADYGMICSSTWMSLGLYALDPEMRPWTLCNSMVSKRGCKWWLVDDLMSGAAARHTHAEEHEGK